jgi:hypothetical protein
MTWHYVIMGFLPGLIAIITKPDWPGTVKYLIALIICAAAAAVEVVMTDGAVLPTFAATFATVFGSYAGIWKPLGAADKVEKNVNG